MLNEFDVVDRFFYRKQKQKNRTDIGLGIGDDAAILSPASDQSLVMSMDTLVVGVHFLQDMPPYDLGYKALAVNLSDLAAMGAKPAWVLLALALPSQASYLNEKWLSDFAAGFFELADAHDVVLVGGDVTAGTLSVTCQVTGLVPNSQSHSLLRSSARVGDLIFVTGILGGAGLALQALKGGVQLTRPDKSSVLACLNHPIPRIQVGHVLRSKATAAIDISDGLIADLGHICQQSQVGAQLHAECLPVHPLLKQYLSRQDALTLAMTAGDDYELCFTAPSFLHDSIMRCVTACGCTCTLVGLVIEGQGVTVYDQGHQLKPFSEEGYVHYV